MLLIAKLLAKLFQILNSEISPNQIAAGFAVGALIGLIPVSSVLPYFLILFAFIVNVNLAMMWFAAAVFKLISFLIDPVANVIGFQLLTKTAALKPFWTKFYNMPVVPYTKFNNTIVLGSIVVGLIGLIPFFFLARWIVVNYRANIQQRLAKLKIVQVIQASTFYRYYLTYKGLKGE